jgi:DICT domain-containing protein
MIGERVHERSAMDNTSETDGLTIGDVAARSGVAEGTLRMWEARYGFPQPRRLPSGHRRYIDQDLVGVAAVLRARNEGLSLSTAIDRARRLGDEPRPSVYWALRERFPYLHPQPLGKPALTWLSRAIEDECCARSNRPVLFGCFQQERFYRQAETRWRSLAAGAQRAVALADFPRLRKPRGAPAEVPIAPADPLVREWVLVCDAEQLSACLAAWERPRTRGEPRQLEVVWSVENEVVREAARVCAQLTARRAPELVEDLRDRLAGAPAPAGPEQLRAAVELATRAVAYAGHHAGAGAAVPGS